MPKSDIERHSKIRKKREQKIQQLNQLIKKNKEEEFKEHRSKSLVKELGLGHSCGHDITYRTRHFKKEGPKNVEEIIKQIKQKKPQAHLRISNESIIRHEQ